MPNQPPRQPAHPRRLPSVIAERGGEVFLTSENQKTSPPGDRRDSGEGANRTVLWGTGIRAGVSPGRFWASSVILSSFFNVHRALFLNGKAPILETVVNFEAPRVAS